MQWSAAFAGQMIRGPEESSRIRTPRRMGGYKTTDCKGKDYDFVVDVLSNKITSNEIF